MQDSLFKHKKLADAQKLRGGYYTPVELARYLATWAIRDGSERVLEPSCGDGNLVISALGRLAQFHNSRNKKEPHLTAVELQEDELEKAQSRSSQYVFPGLTTKWICDDFFSAYRPLKRSKLFDVVLGNPPFIRFQYFNSESRDVAFENLRAAGYKPTKLANAWAGFVQLSIELLKEGGRLAMVVPAELLQVGYAAELRERFVSQFDDVTIVGFEKLVFPEIQQEVVLVLAEGKNSESANTGTLHTLEYKDGSCLPSEMSFVDSVSHAPAKYTRAGMKWTSLFLSESDYKSLNRVESRKDLLRIGDFAKVEVGVVTGRNSFFLLKQNELKETGSKRFVTNVVGRTNALKSILFTDEDFEAYARSQPAYLLDLKGHKESRLPKALKQYINLGEEEGVDQGYKCRIRKRWYDVPSIYEPDGFMYRQIHNYPMVVANNVGATSTDTIHRVRMTGDLSIERLSFRSFNSLSFAWAEVCGRSYGGGVLELEPREALELPLPNGDFGSDEISQVDSLLRQGRSDDALLLTDGILLRDGMGLSVREIRRIRNCWETLRDRRINRK